MKFRDKLYSLFKFHLCLSNGVCDRDGHYVPIDDAINGDFDSNRKHFREGETFPGDKEWIRIPSE